MIIITLAGNSTRFFKAGYDLVKYKLPLGDSSVLEEIIKYLPRCELIVIVINKKFLDRTWIISLLDNLSFTNYHIVELLDTKGQLETVKLAIDSLKDVINVNDELTIYNGDTLRKCYTWNGYLGDGFIEVFKASGDHWSFVDQLGEVNLVSEKVRISNYCSSGLYYFKSASLLCDHYNQYVNNVSSELYVAPFYDFLIKKGFKIYSGEVNVSNFVFCGTPDEYEVSKLLY